MLNIKPVVSEDGKELTIKVDLTQNNGNSKSGKSTIIASTQGNVPLGNDGVRMGINLYKINTTVKN